MNLCLGTVQFGVDYGIHGRKKPSVDEAISMMNFAVGHGVDAIDTSALYGEAEEVVGRFMRQSPVRRDELFLVSKFGIKEFEGLSEAECVHRIVDVAHASLARMGVDYLDAYICHVSDAVRDGRIICAMAALRDSGLARKIGFSVYETKEAEIAINTRVVDFLQLPLSVLDQRMAQSGVLELAAGHGVELHARSIYVQGLALMASCDVPDYLGAIRPRIEALHQLCKSAGISRRSLAFAFVRRFPQMSHVVFGVHDMRQLKENIESFVVDVPKDVLDDAEDIFRDVDPSLVMPNKWRKQ